MREKDREERIRDALNHVRNALVAGVAGAPVLPALHMAEEELLYCLFSPNEVAEYLASAGAKIYGR